jgi:hypothetical protein
MKKRTVPLLASLWILLAAFISGGASPAGAEGATNPVQNASAESPGVQGPIVQGPIVMGRSVALRHKTKLHHVKVKSAAVTASNLEKDADSQ